MSYQKDKKGSYKRREPKKARQVEIPEDRPLTLDEYKDLSQHAYNTIVFWANQGKTEGEIFEKLLSKGYTEERVSYLPEDSTEEITVDLLTDAFEKAEEGFVLMPEDMLSRLIAEEYTRAGKSPQELRSKLFRRKFTETAIKKALSDFYKEEVAIELTYPSLERRYLREEDPAKIKQAVKTKLFQRGFSSKAISELFEALEGKEAYGDTSSSDRDYGDED